MTIVEPIKIGGLRQFSKDLRKIDAELPKELRKVGNAAAELVVTTGRPKIPKRSGAAARSLRVASTRTAARVRAGGARVPYYPWLDYGGEGRIKGRPAARKFVKTGRYLYPSYYAVRDQVATELEAGLRRVASSTGWEVT